MTYPPSGRHTGRPGKAHYSITSGRPDGALSVRVREAFAELSDSQIEAIRLMVTDIDVRLASLAAIALGIGFERPDTPASMKTRIAAHELLMRASGDVQLAPGPLHVHSHGQGQPVAKVTFVRGDDQPATVDVSLEAGDPAPVIQVDRPELVPETDVSATVETPDPDPEHPQG